MNTQILAIGNALVDIIARVEPDFLIQVGIAPGGMTLVDADTSAALYAKIRNAREVSGGSAANTAAVAANLGARVAFAGKVAPDQLGTIFNHDMASLDIHTVAAPTEVSPGFSTGSCISLITPDGQRSMVTHLGAAQSLRAVDLDPEILMFSRMVFIEGYLLDAPNGYDIVSRAVEHHGGRVALTLSDAGCVARHHGFLMESLDGIDLLFGNAEEICALYPGYDLASILVQTGLRVPQVICTDGSNGVYLAEVYSGGEITHIPAQKADVVDTTGAGDSFAGTVLWGLANGFNLETSARMAMTVAAKVISEIGARPSCDLLPLLQAAGHLPADAIPA
jgi:fructokinase